MINQSILAGVLCTALAAPVYAGHREDNDYAGNVFYDKARVTQVRELKERVQVPVNHEECWSEEVEHRGRRGNPDAGMIAGGILGGVLGNQIGRGRGKKVATVAGIILGGSIGRDVASRPAETHVSSERHCRVSNRYYEEERITGYQVTYRYRGRTFTREMTQHPGRFVRVRVAVAPMEDYDD